MISCGRSLVILIKMLCYLLAIPKFVYIILSGPGWGKANINGPICFGTKNDAFGRFTIQVAGGIVAVKFVHVSGAVANSKNTSGANWGNPSHQILTVLTDDGNNVLLPLKYTPREPYTYTLQGYSSTSPELLFNITNPSSPSSPVSFSGRIWFVEDLFDYSEGDNSGETCMDLFILYPI